MKMGVELFTPLEMFSLLFKGESIYQKYLFFSIATKILSPNKVQ